MKALYWTVGGIVVAVSGNLLGIINTASGVGLSAIAALCGLYGAFRQDRESKPFVLMVDESTWRPSVHCEYEILTLARDHGKGSSVTTTFYVLTEPGRYDECIVDVNLLANNDVRVAIATMPIRGKLVIR